MASEGFGGLAYDSTPAQRQATLAVAMAGVALASICAGMAGADWPWWRWTAVLFVAFDLVGGVAAMCLPPAIRKIRPPGDPLRPVVFAAFHIHPFVLMLVVPGAGWAGLAATYAFGVGGVLAVAACPREFRASAALGWCAFALAVVALVGMPRGLEWLAPAFLLKLVGSHAAGN